MTIEISAKAVYGKTLYYVVTASAKEAISVLTGKKTVTAEQIEALRTLGFNVKVNELPA
jgi:hypothetical protein